jgi:hypothetical protein
MAAAAAAAPSAKDLTAVLDAIDPSHGLAKAFASQDVKSVVEAKKLSIEEIEKILRKEIREEEPTVGHVRRIHSGIQEFVLTQVQDGVARGAASSGEEALIRSRRATPIDEHAPAAGAPSAAPASDSSVAAPMLLYVHQKIENDELQRYLSGKRESYDIHYVAGLDSSTRVAQDSIDPNRRVTLLPSAVVDTLPKWRTTASTPPRSRWPHCAQTPMAIRAHGRRVRCVCGAGGWRNTSRPTSRYSSTLSRRGCVGTRSSSRASLMASRSFQRLLIWVSNGARSATRSRAKVRS